MTPVDRLRTHDAEFEKTVFELASDVYLAVGFAASNVGMIVGDDGLIIIDTTESTKAAEDILAEFRKITDKPVTTIIYTHSHRDHISGATIFAPRVVISSGKLLSSLRFLSARCSALNRSVLDTATIGIWMPRAAK